MKGYTDEMATHQGNSGEKHTHLKRQKRWIKHRKDTRLSATAPDDDDVAIHCENESASEGAQARTPPQLNRTIRTSGGQHALCTQLIIHNPVKQRCLPTGERGPHSPFTHTHPSPKHMVGNLRTDRSVGVQTATHSKGSGRIAMFPLCVL